MIEKADNISLEETHLKLSSGLEVNIDLSHAVMHAAYITYPMQDEVIKMIHTPTLECNVDYIWKSYPGMRTTSAKNSTDISVGILLWH